MALRSTYETAPVFTLMESVVLSKMRQYVGWTEDEGDGILAPGHHYDVILSKQQTMQRSRC